MDTIIKIKQNSKILDIVDWAGRNFGYDQFELKTTYPGDYDFVFKKSNHALIFRLKWYSQ
jgi:hypothetical protein